MAFVTVVVTMKIFFVLDTITVWRYSVKQEAYMIIDLLRKLGCNLSELSRKSGVPYSTLSDIANEKTPIDKVSVGVIKKLSQASDISMDEIYDILQKRPALVYKTQADYPISGRLRTKVERIRFDVGETECRFKYIGDNKFDICYMYDGAEQHVPFKGIVNKDRLATLPQLGQLIIERDMDNRDFEKRALLYAKALNQKHDEVDKL